MEDKKELMEHLDEHIKYPATKEDIVAACNQMSHVPEEDKKMVEERLPEKTYNNSEEVAQALGMQQEE